MSRPGALQLARAVAVLQSGGVIAYPTEGVWGLGCDPADPAAVERLLQLKGRPVSKGLILVAASVAQLGSLLDGVPAARLPELLRSWPGPVTWTVPAPAALPAWIRGSHPSVAVRVSNHSPVVALCEAFGAPIVSTSANPQGRPAARSALAVRRYFRGELDYLLPGSLGTQRGASEIRDALSGRVLRAA